MEPRSSRLLEKGTFGPIIGSLRKVTDAGVNYMYLGGQL
jgi:hypothetical protein